MKFDKVHCLFEQSGTFKGIFIDLGHKAYDYDILNDFGKTDFTNDLFKEIHQAYKGEPSIFDTFSQDDLILAFFPCVRFDKLIILHINGTSNGMSNWPLERKLENSMRLIDEVNEYYRLISMLVIVCLRKCLRLVIENPFGSEHFLTRYWPIKPSIIDIDRTLFGDDFKKPTQYWFINCEPENNIPFGSCFDFGKAKKQVLDCSTVQRSMISPTYAYNFIRDFILEPGEVDK